MYPLDRQMYP